MTQEEKAKAYDEALEKAKDYKNDIIHHELEIGENIMDYIFPELKESEGEMIKKCLINWMKFFYDDNKEATLGINKLKVKDIIAWLEKQGEQKPINYNEELKKCRENPLYFIDNHVKLEEKKPIELSEEDKKMINILIKIFEIHHSDLVYPVNLEDITGRQIISSHDIIKWLKSLKERLPWQLVEKK